MQLSLSQRTNEFSQLMQCRDAAHSVMQTNRYTTHSMWCACDELTVTNGNKDFESNLLTFSRWSYLCTCLFDHTCVSVFRSPMVYIFLFFIFIFVFWFQNFKMSFVAFLVESIVATLLVVENM